MIEIESKGDELEKEISDLYILILKYDAFSVLQRNQCFIKVYLKNKIKKEFLINVL